MGASFQTMIVPGTKTRTEVEKIFADAQDQDRYENGHSYSGGFGMARGISFPGNTFADAVAAENWLDEKAIKWEAALCVSFKSKNDADYWMIGAVCAS